MASPTFIMHFTHEDNLEWILDQGRSVVWPRVSDISVEPSQHRVFQRQGAAGADHG